MLRLSDWEVSLPIAFEETESTTVDQPPDNDDKHVTIFAQLAIMSVIVEKAMWACNHPSVFYNSGVLTRMASGLRGGFEDSKVLSDVEAYMKEWRRYVAALMTSCRPTGLTTVTCLGL